MSPIPPAAREVIRGLLAAIKAKDCLLASYRIQRPPSQKLWRELLRATEAVQAAEDFMAELAKETS